MPQFAPLSLSADNAVTTSTFSPATIKGDVAAYEDRALGVSIGYPRVTASVARPSKTSRLSKVRLKVVVPVLEAVTGTNLTGVTPPAAVAYTTSADIVFMLPERSNLNQRQALLYLVQSLLAAAEVSALVVNNESIY